MSVRYAHTNIVADDWRQLAAFYRAVFACEPVPPERDQAGEWLARASDLVVRLGSDEFTVLPEASLHSASRIVAKRYQAALEKPVEVAGTVVRPTISIGIAAYTAEVEDLQDLIDRADHAMYRTKERGSGICPSSDNGAD